MIDGLLMLGFGGPTPGCCERRARCSREPGCEAECFVSGILGDNPARAARVAEVVAHYRLLGGFSRFNALTQAQADALGASLAARGRALPIACGFRHWRPWTSEAVASLAARGCRELGVLVMAPHQSSVSWDWYLTTAAEAVEAAAAAGGEQVRISGIAEPWWEEPGFIAALAERIAEAVAPWDEPRRAAARLIFTAHAIPQPVASRAPYARQFAATAAVAARACGHPEHAIAYQSQPSDSTIPWTGPDIVAAVDAAADAGARDVIVCAAGFLVDHTEVLYDLDHEAQARARARGLGWARARSVHDHPAFIDMLARRVAAL
jgi:ferrochelatase